MYNVENRMIKNGEGNRVNYIDVIKGTTILIIVFNHIRIFSLEIDPNTSAISMFFVSFMVPMFFFISGFVNGFKDERMSFKVLNVVIIRKFRVLVLPTIVFYGMSRLVGIYDWAFPGGFWFTFTLFIMFFLLYVSRYLLQFVKGMWFSVIFLLFSLGLLATNAFGDFNCLNRYIGFDELRNNTIYFAIGILCNSWRYLYSRCLANQICITIMAVVAMILLIMQYNGIILDFVPGAVGMIWTVKALSIIFILLALFKDNAEYWDSDFRIPKLMRYIGRKTLDIYMIHFFFLPSIPLLSLWFEPKGNSVIEFCIISVILIGVIALSLFVSALINTSYILSYIALGRKSIQKIPS